MEKTPMHIESLTGEIEEWLEKAEEEENLKFIKQEDFELSKGTIVIEMLGYYGSVSQIVAEEIQRMSSEKKKLAGFFSSYINEMVQLLSEEILLPITLLQSKIGSKEFILTTSNFAIPDVISYQLSEELYAFYRRHNVSKIYLLDGVHNYSRNINTIPQVHRISTEGFKIRVENQKPANFTLMGQIASSFLTYWSHNDGIPIEIFVVDAFADFDPISSLELLKVIAQEWALKGDFRELGRKSQEFQQLYLQSREKTKKERLEDSTDPRFFV